MRPDRDEQTDGDSADLDALDETFADVVGPLRRLAERLDAASYPGEAWPAGRPARRRRAFRLAVTSAAAAAILLAVGAAYRLGRLSGPASVPAPRPKVAATAPAQTQPTRRIAAARIDPSIASHVTWRMPRVSVPSTRDANGVTWSLPSFTFPSFGSRSAKRGPKPTTQPKAT